MALSPGMRVPPGQHSDDQAGSTERWRHLLFKMAPQCLLRGRHSVVLFKPQISAPGRPGPRMPRAAGRGGLQGPARRPRDSPGRGSAGTGRPLRLLLAAPRVARAAARPQGPSGGTRRPPPALPERTFESGLGSCAGRAHLRVRPQDSSPAPRPDSKVRSASTGGGAVTVGTLHWQHSKLCR
jgi:hypothetical protein